MALRDLTVDKAPGDDGFVDEVNSVLLELASVAQKVLRVELQYVNWNGNRAIEHNLGVRPDFVWGFRETPNVVTPEGSDLTVSSADMDTWTDKMIRFSLAGSAHFVFIIALR